jgi:hypothetical protein
MTDEATLEIFDSKGALRRDFKDSEIEALTPARRERFFKLVEASTDAETAEQEVRDADANVKDCVVKLQEATNAHNAAHPRPDRIDELRRVIAAQNAALR